MGGKALIQLSKNYLIYKPLTNRFIKTFKGKDDEKLKVDLGSLKDFNVDMSKKKISIIVDGEEIYIKLFTFPKNVKNNLYNTISCELKFRFKNIDNIMFTYSILNYKKDTIDVLVFCMNSVKLDILKKILDNGLNIKAVYPIQFCALNKYKRRIKEENYIFIFLYEENLYVLACIKNHILCSELVKDFKVKDFFIVIKEFKDKCYSKGLNVKFNKLYFNNFPYKDIVNIMSEKVCCVDLGDFNIDKVEEI